MVTTAGFRRGVITLLLALVGLTVLVAASTLVAGPRQDTSSIPQEQYHEWATSSDTLTFTEVGQHYVIVPPVEKEPSEIASDYVTRSLGAPVGCSTVGEFHADTGEIWITGLQERFEAGLEADFRPHFYRTLRHEYGHAAFYEWTQAEGLYPFSARFQALAEDGAEPKVADYPPLLRPAIVEWSDVGEDLYGNPHFTKNFNEYIAESYARLLRGESVPPGTERFLMEAYGGTRTD